MDVSDSRISASVDVLIQYKAGDLNLLEAIERFSSLTGLPRDSAENFIRGMTRNNVLPLAKRHNGKG